MTASLKTSRKKRVSKKLKVSWRKHVDITDVEEYLEEKRFEERLGPPLETLANDELFKLDSTPVEKEEVLSAAERKKLRLLRPLKCFSALQPHTKVPDPISKRNRVRSKEERKSEFVKKKESAIIKAKHRLAEKNRNLAEKRRNSRPKRGQFDLDIWGSSEENEKERSFKDVWLEKNTTKHNLKNLGVPQKKVVDSVKKKTSYFPSIEPPHPGMSYNPSFEDHQELLNIVATKEKEIMKKEEHLTRVTRGMFQKVSAQKRDSDWLVEMSEGLPSQEGTSVEENQEDGEPTDDESTYKTVNPPVENKKKSVKQRRKQKEQKELQKALLAKKLEKKKIADIHQIKTLNKKIEKVAEKQKLNNEKRQKRKELKKMDVKRISSTKFEEPGLEFNMGHDIAGNLRNLKKEGSLLMDRFKSLQKRNILEPSTKRTRKNAKVKRYTKPGHKEDWKKTVAK